MRTLKSAITLPQASLLGLLLLTGALFANAQSLPFPGPGGVAPGGGGGSHVFTLVQHKASAPCSTSSASCSITGLSAIGSGHILVVLVGYAASAQRTISTVACTSTGCGAFTRCSTCAGFESGGIGNNIGNEAAYNLSSTSGGTTVTVTMSAVPASGWDFDFREYSYNGASTSFDVGGVGGDATCTTCAGQALTLTGTDDVIVQAIAPVNSCSAITTYGNTDFTTNGDGYADLLNTASGTAPNWTCSSGSAGVNAIAIKGN